MYLIHKFYLPVTYLHTYFKNGKRVYFEPNNSQNAIKNLKKKSTTLIPFLNLSQNNDLSIYDCTSNK